MINTFGKVLNFGKGYWFTEYQIFKLDFVNLQSKKPIKCPDK
jgi:hypothetical protein